MDFSAWGKYSLTALFGFSLGLAGTILSTTIENRSEIAVLKVQNEAVYRALGRLEAKVDRALNIGKNQ